MIVDAHCHVMTWDNIPDKYWNELARIAVEFYKNNGFGKFTVDQFKNEILDTIMDPDGTKLLANMDASGVDKSIILALDWGSGIGEAEKSIDEINEFYGSLAKKHPDRIVAFAGVDPRRPDAVEILDRAINSYGCRGLKYHPTTGFYPDSEESYRVLEKAGELGIPLLSHTGPISRPYKSKYARPVFLDTVVTDFPDLTVIGAHMGFVWNKELIGLIAANNTTFYADFSGNQMLAARDFEEFCHLLRGAFDEAGASKFLWGTDNPILELVIPMNNWLKMIRNLPETAPEGIDFTVKEIDAVLGGNAEEIIKSIN